MKKLLAIAAILLSLPATAQIKISQLPPVSVLQGPEETIVNQGGVTKRAAVSQLPFIDAVKKSGDSIYVRILGAWVYCFRDSAGSSGGAADGNNYLTGLSFNAGTGNLTAGRNGLASVAANLDGRYTLLSSPAGSVSGTDTGNWNNAFRWGNHAAAGYLYASTATSTYVPQSRTVNGLPLSGNVNLNTGNITEGSNLYFNNARARSAISGTGLASYNSSTGVMSVATPSLQQVTSAGGTTTNEIFVTDGTGFTAGMIAGGFLAVDPNGRTVGVTTDGLSIKTKPGGGTEKALFRTDSLSAPRTFQMPDSSGTFATQWWVKANRSAVGLLTVSGGATLTGAGTLASPYNIAVTGGGGGGISGSGTANYLTKWTGSGAVGNSRLTDDGTTISLGGNAEVAGSFSMVGNSTMYFARNKGIAANGGIKPNDYTPFLVTSDAYPTYGSFGFYDAAAGAFIINNGSAAAAPLWFGLDGKIGINATFPSQALVVGGNVSINGYVDFPNIGYDPPAPASGSRLYNNGGVLKVINAGESSPTVIH